MISCKNQTLCVPESRVLDKVPENVLVIKRIYSNDVTTIAAVLALWLKAQWGCQVYVELTALEDYYRMGCTSVHPLTVEMRVTIDFVVSLGGDGTTLWALSLFPGDVPPLLGVTLGSLSYINQFHVDDMVPLITEIFSSRQCSFQLRSRLLVSIYGKEAEPLYFGHCINECVIDRGPSSNMASLDIFVNNHFFTSMSADGLILATPTGSTAYSMSAGGAVVHPCVPCVLFTPICPHSLSMRPLVLPSQAEIRIKVPDDARGGVWLAIDGHNKHAILPGHHVIVTVSDSPIPLLCKADCQRCGDAWLQSLTDNLFWGLRIRQRKFDRAAPSRLTSEALPDDLRKWFHQYTQKKDS